ncbi:MAG: LamG domain-containing protein [Polyangiaceae bacterium]
MPAGEACAAAGGAGGALAEGGAGAASPSAGGAGGAGTAARHRPGGSGSGGSCPSPTEDCLTAADEDCGDDANAGCGLILYLAFDEGAGATAVDSSGRGNDGTHSSTYVAGVRGTALSFDGSKGVVIDASPDLVWGADGEPFTVAFWLRVTGAPTTFWRGLIHKGNTDCGVGDRTTAMFLAPMAQVMHVAVSSASVVDPLLCYQYALNSGDVPVNQWVHVASVVDGVEMRLYFDGVLNASVAADNVISNEAPVYIGHDPFYTGLVGEMDELQIYDRALSEADIGALLAPP